MTLGPFVGGALTTLGDWRWAFLVNVPIVAATAIAAPRVLPETPRHPGRRLPDPFGALLLTLGAAALTLALSQVSDWGVPRPADDRECGRRRGAPARCSYAARATSPSRCSTWRCSGVGGWPSPRR